MTDKSSNGVFTPESGEMSCLAGFTELDETTLFRALHDPDNFEKYLKREDRHRLADALVRLIAMQHELSRVLDRAALRVIDW